MKSEVLLKESEVSILAGVAHLLKRLLYNYEQLCLSKHDHKFCKNAQALL